MVLRFPWRLYDATCYAPAVQEARSRIAQTLRTSALAAASPFYVAAGINHFRNPDFYTRIVPPGLPSPRALVAISGYAEIAGGIGLAIRPLRRAAGWGLIALLLAVFPANIYMAMHPEKFKDVPLPRWSFYARLPLQGVLIAWVWYASRLSNRAPAESLTKR